MIKGLLVAALLVGFAGVVTPAVAQDATKDPLMLDVDVGWLQEGGAKLVADEDEDAPGARFNGWTIGGSIRFVPCVGIATTIARTWSADEGTRFLHYATGPRVVTPYWTEFGLRAFAHAQFGMVDARVGSATPEGGGTGFDERAPEIVIGGGFDVMLVRLQFDYQRSFSDRLAFINGSRVTVGASVPLCLRGCRDE